MNWELLLLLACPLMMVFCMKGMFSGNKDSKKESNVNQTQQSELQSLQIKMAELMEQNHKLTQEMENLKNPKSDDTNVITLNKTQSS